MEREYRILLTDEPAARAAAKSKAADEFNVDPETVSIVGTAKHEDHSGTIGWRVRVRIG